MNNQEDQIGENVNPKDPHQVSEFEYLVRYDLKSLKSTLVTEKYNVWVMQYGQVKAKELIQDLVFKISDKISYKRTESKHDLFDWAVKTFGLDLTPAIIQQQTIIQRQEYITNNNIHTEQKTRNDNRKTETVNYNNQFNQFNQFTDSKTETVKKKSTRSPKSKTQKKQNSKKVSTKMKGKKVKREYLPNLKYTDEMIEKFWSIRGETKQPLEDCYSVLQEYYVGKTKIQWGDYDSFIRSARKRKTSKR